MTPPPDDDARRWLAALAARVEDDPDLLDGLSDAEAERLLAREDVRASGVAASIRRRLREAGATETRERVGRPPRRSLRTWAGSLGVLGSLWSWWWNAPPEARRADRRWAIGAIAVAALVVAASVWALRPGGGTAVGEVLQHRAELVSIIGPPVKGDLPPLARGARDLLAAAESDPPDGPLALQAAEAFAEAVGANSHPGRAAQAAYFAGLAYRLGGDADEGARWLRRVPEGSAYAERAADLL